MKKRKVLSILLSLMIILSMAAPGFALNHSQVQIYSQIDAVELHKMQLTQNIMDALVQLGLEGEVQNADEQIELLVISQLESDVTNRLYRAGATKVNRFVEGAYLITISAKNVFELVSISELVGVGINRSIDLSPPQKTPIFLPNLEYSHEDTTIKELWDAGYNGEGMVVAIIDTGVEPNHELLKLTTDGKLKIIDHQDFNHAETYADEPTEGDIRLTEINVTSETVNIPFRYLENGQWKDSQKTATVPAFLVGKKILGGVFSELRLFTDQEGGFFDTNNNGVADRFIVVCYDGNQDGNYESILFDTNNNNDLSDEKTMGIYKNVATDLKDEIIFELDANGVVQLDENNYPIVKESYRTQYDRLYNTIENTITDEENILSKTQFNFVVSRVDRTTFGSWYANILYDTGGHGTHVAGDAAANGYLEHDFVNKDIEPTGRILGAAPGAQIMDLKVFETQGGTKEDRYIRAMQYAAVNGADIVNLSLGALYGISDGSSMGPMYADLLTIKYGTIFVIANGNDGPGVNSNATPADSWFALTVGAYCPSYYVVGSQFENAEDQMWIFSANGPTSDGRIKPEVVAPGSMVSAEPMWNVIGAGYDETGAFKDIIDTGELIVGYSRAQGTSMAAPYVAGMAAALRQAVNTEGIPYHPLLFKDAILHSADHTINNNKYTHVEIGRGMINPIESLYELRKMKDSDKLPQLITGQEPIAEWPYNYDDGNLKYTTYDDIYIYPKVLFKNSDKMRYVNAVGVYARDREIPDVVEVELHNATNRDVNLEISKLTFGKGQLTDWVEIQQSIFIEKGQKSSLMIEFDKSKLTEGINSMILELNDPETYQLDANIPITIIHTPKLGFDNYYIQSQSDIKPGAYSRQFVKIDNSLDKFKITVEVPEESNGRVKPFIFFPNGVAYYWDEIYDFAGIQRPDEIENGKPEFVSKLEIIIDRKALELADSDVMSYNPNRQWMWEGTWEIATYCSYASQETVNTTVAVSTAGLLMSQQSAKLEIAAGEQYEGSITVLNTTGEDIKTGSHGFIDLENNKEKERIMAFGEFRSIERGFFVREGEENVFHRLITTNPSYGEGARVWLFLYKAKLNHDGSYELIRPFINKYINVQLNGMENQMITWNLEPGYYVYALFGGMMEYGPVDFDVISQVINESDAINNTLEIQAPITIKDGEAATIYYTAKAPIEAGDYLSRITFRDEDGKTVNSFNIFAEVEGTQKILQVKQQNMALFEEEVILEINALFPQDTINKEHLYGLDFEMSYDPEKITALEVIRGDVFTNANSYPVKLEIIKDENGTELGTIRFAYAFKGLYMDGIKEGNVAKIKFQSKTMGAAPVDIKQLLVGNYEGRQLAVRVERQNIMTANPDINQDSVVDMKDFAYIAYSYGAVEGDLRYRSRADINKDGVIDDIDLNYIIQYFDFIY